MPMDFPDLTSLKMAAKIHKFRPMMDRESEEHYRSALADHVRPIDHIESFEIRFGVGWDKWSDDQKRQSIFG
jgi:hypothetical protein